MLKSLFFILHNRRAVGKIVGNKACDVTVGMLQTDKWTKSKQIMPAEQWANSFIISQVK